jgi:hypothetical protein
MFTLDPTVVATITGVLLPLLVGLVTKAAAPPKVKAIVNIVASAAAALLLNALNANGYAVVSGPMLATWLQQTVIAVAAYLGVWKPLDATSRLLPARGLGTAPAAE